MPISRLTNILIVLLLAPAVFAGEASQTESIDRSCILQQVQGDAANSNDPVDATLPFGLSVLDPDFTADDSTIDMDLTCAPGRVEGVTIRQYPGQVSVVTFLLTHQAPGIARFAVNTVATAGSGDEWISVDPEAGQAPAGMPTPIRLVLRASDALPPGSVHQFVLEFALVQDLGEFSAEVPVRVEIRDQPELFRNRFEVNPLPGQFSFVFPRG